LFFRRAAGPRRTCLVLENHSIFGGLARQNEFVVGGQRLVSHQASTLFFPPYEGTPLSELYRSIGIDADVFDYQRWANGEPEIAVGTTPYFGGGRNSAYYFGPRFGQRPGRLFV